MLALKFHRWMALNSDLPVFTSRTVGWRLQPDTVPRLLTKCPVAHGHALVMAGKRLAAPTITSGASTQSSRSATNAQNNGNIARRSNRLPTASKDAGDSKHTASKTPGVTKGPSELSRTPPEPNLDLWVRIVGCRSASRANIVNGAALYCDWTIGLPLFRTLRRRDPNSWSKPHS